MGIFMNVILYLDMYILTNTIINSVLLLFSGRYSKLIIKPLRIVFGAFSGSVLSLVVIFLPVYISGIIKVIIALMMCMLSFKTSTKQFIKITGTYFIYSFILSGIMLAIANVKSLVSIGTFNYGSVSVVAICLALITIFSLHKTLIRLIKRQAQNTNLYKTVIVTIGKTSKTLIGFCDSGNTLFDNESNLPVFVANYDCFKEMIKNNKPTYSTIECNTILGKGTIEIFKPTSIIIDDVHVSAMIGLNNNNFNSDYDIILSSCISNNNLKKINIKETENLYV